MLYPLLTIVNKAPADLNWSDVNVSMHVRLKFPVWKPHNKPQCRLGCIHTVLGSFQWYMLDGFSAVLMRSKS
jgi:hypothetical protein